MTKLRESTKTPPTDAPLRRAGRSPLRPHVLSAIFARDFLGYFTNPAGYVFITLFVVVCSWAEFWQPVFFANNLANLAPLNAWMPYILLFFIPAITMATWAEERKQGTEELLLTLPARDVEVVLGKYFAALGIFTVAILFLAVGHVPILCYLGRPDTGILLANYLGYWLIGGMLIAFGMVASMLSSSATVAFILGAAFGSIPVFAELIAVPASRTVGRFLTSLSVPEQFRDFGTGVVTLSGVLYFASWTIALLYLNMVLLGRRQWAGGQESRHRLMHASARFLAVVVALVSLDVLAEKTLGSARLDLTEEQLHTLSPETIKIIRAIPKDRPVFIDAYVSPEVPREYVQVRLELIDTLKEFAALGGSRIRLNLVPAERYSTAARDAEKRYGIAPREVRTVEAARQETAEITMGVAFTSGLEEVVIPFFDRGLPVEAELARSVRVASGEARKRVGILATDAKLMGGMDFQTMSNEGQWMIVDDLKKQYEVTTIAPDAPIPTTLDALIVAQPSSLSPRQLPHLVRYIRSGGPTLLLVDPFPGLVGNMELVPKVPRRPAGGMMGGGAPPEPKANIRPLMNMLGVAWPDDEIVWSNHNPHKKFSVPREAVFVTRDLGPNAFGRDETTTGLQEVFLLYPGMLAPMAGATTQFTPLLSTDDLGGTVAFDELFQQGPFGPEPNSTPGRVPGLQPYTLAARVTGPLPPDPNPPPGPDGKPMPAQPGRADVILVADLDFIVDQFVRIRLKPNEQLDELDFDNVSFLMNCVDSLAGEDAFIPLRARKARHRTLRAVEDQSQQYVQKADDEAKKADEVAKAQIAAAQARLTAQVDAIRSSKEIEERDKPQAIRYRQTVEQRRLDLATAEIEDRQRSRIEDARASVEQSIRAIQTGIRVWALVLAPLPSLILGGIVFFYRKRSENLGATPTRLA